MYIIALIYIISAQLVCEVWLEYRYIGFFDFEFQVKIGLVVKVFVCSSSGEILLILNAGLKIIKALSIY